MPKSPYKRPAAEVSQKDFFADQRYEADKAAELSSVFGKSGSSVQYERFPEGTEQVVVFGLNGSLMHFDETELEAAFQKRSVEAFHSIYKGKEYPTDETLKRMVHESYLETGFPSRHLSKKFGVNEAWLMSETLSRVYTQDISADRNRFNMADQGLLNYMAHAQAQGVGFMVVSGGTCKWAENCLQGVVLRQYVTHVLGIESLISADRKQYSKGENPVEILRDIVRPLIPADIPNHKILVADDNARFVAGAPHLGMRSALIRPPLSTKKYLRGITFPDAKAYPDNTAFPVTVASAEQMFEKLLGIKNPGTHRDTHVYAGIRGVKNVIA